MKRGSLNLVGTRVKQARNVAKPRITQQQLSDLLSELGVSIDRAGIAKVETGIRSVFDYELVALATALHVKVTWLLGVKG